jgi:hypothetical protein
LSALIEMVLLPFPHYCCDGAWTRGPHVGPVLFDELQARLSGVFAVNLGPAGWTIHKGRTQ